MMHIIQSTILMIVNGKTVVGLRHTFNLHLKWKQIEDMEEKQDGYRFISN